MKNVHEIEKIFTKLAGTNSSVFHLTILRNTSI
jgi:hypothetical protein